MFPAVQWLGFHASTAGSMGSIRGAGTKMLHDALKKTPKEDDGEGNLGTAGANKQTLAATGM